MQTTTDTEDTEDTIDTIDLGYRLLDDTKDIQSTNTDIQRTNTDIQLTNTFDEMTDISLDKISNSNPNQNKNIQIVFSGGGYGNGCIQLGISQYIYETYNLKSYSDRIHVGGSSIGTISGIILLSSIHNIDTPAKWFENEYLKVAENAGNSILKLIHPSLAKYCGCLFSTTSALEKVSKKFYKKCKQLNPNFNLILNNHFHCHISKLSFFGLSDYIIDKFDTSSDFTFALTSTTLLPFLSVIPFNIRGCMCFCDGCYAGYEPYKHNPLTTPTIYFNINKLSTSSYDSTYNYEDFYNININDWIDLELKHILVYGDVEYNRKLFELGYAMAEKHKAELDAFFLKYLINDNLF